MSQPLIVTFGFEEALSLIKQGKKVGRREWKNALFVYLVPGSTFIPNREPLATFFCGADGTIGTWAPSMVDLMAEDWFIH